MRAWQGISRRCLACPPVRLPVRQIRGAAGVASSETTVITPAMLNRAQTIASQHVELSNQLAQGGYSADISKRIGELSPTVTALREYEAAKGALDELQQLLDDPSTDKELREIAAEEHDGTQRKVEGCVERLKGSLVPAHPFAAMPCMLELRPGAGGSEASIFAADLLEMYQAFCRRHRLRATLLKLDAGDAVGGVGAVQEAILEIDDPGAYGLLRCEAGVHRVQRVPATETKGRTHTSAVGVLVLPSFPENPNDELGASTFNDPTSDYYIDPKDVRTDVMRAQGAGGQHVNKTESKVRLTHVPTNTVVEMQESRSQHKNREKAWAVLRSRIAQARREAREDELARIRVAVVGVARMGRGDKVRTYNWGQQRVTDHRSGLTSHALDDCIAGGPSLDDVMHSVRVWQSEQDLKALMAEEEAVAATNSAAAANAGTKTKKS